MTPMTATTWTRVCTLDQLIPERGVAALVGGEPVALFLLRRRHACTPSATTTRSAAPT